MSAPSDEHRRAALYEAVKAYNAEAKRLGMHEHTTIARCLIVAIDAFNEEMAEPEEIDLIDDEDDETKKAPV